MPVKKTASVSASKPTPKPTATKKRGYAEATVTAKRPIKNPNMVVKTTISHPSNPNASMGQKLRVPTGTKVPAKMSSKDYESKWKKFKA